MQHTSIELLSEPLIEYLTNHGWTLTDSSRGIAVLRKIIGDQRNQILLPIDRDFSDYRERVWDAIHFLVKYEGRSERDILDDIIPPKWDTLRIRIQGDHIGNGWISYLDKARIEEGIRKLLFAAARSVLDPKPYFKRLYSITAEQWMRKCRAGAAEAGSYILSVQMPLEEDLDSSNFPFSRKVTEHLMTSLNQLTQHPDKADVNANLCLGLAEMKPDESTIQFDFEMKWSADVPVNKSIPAKIQIQDRHFPAIKRLGQRLKPQTEVSKNLFVGKVFALRGEGDEDGRMSGEVILALSMDKQQVKAKVDLGAAMYALACDAHKQNLPVRVSGSLSEKSRGSDLLDVTLFEII